jgi:hypothetical protein
MLSQKQSINYKIISVLLLLVYCFGISSLFISHNHDNHNHENHENHDNHSHEHNHNHKLTYCESINDISNSYSECSHSSHLNIDELSCLLCDHTAFIDDSVLNNSNNYQTTFFLNENNQLIVSEHLIISINLSNKSPPNLI